MIKDVTLHVFSDGCGLLDLGESATPQEVQEFNAIWIKAVVDLSKEPLFVGGAKVTIIEHANPLKKVEVIE